MVDGVFRTFYVKSYATQYVAYYSTKSITGLSLVVQSVDGILDIYGKKGSYGDIEVPSQLLYQSKLSVSSDGPKYFTIYITSNQTLYFAITCRFNSNCFIIFALSSIAPSDIFTIILGAGFGGLATVLLVGMLILWRMHAKVKARRLELMRIRERTLDLQRETDANYTVQFDGHKHYPELTFKEVKITILSLRKIIQFPKTCTICFEDFSIDSKCRLLSCYHTYHADCIDNWFKRDSTCPNCKRDFMETGVIEYNIDEFNDTQEVKDHFLASDAFHHGAKKMTEIKGVGRANSLPMIEVRPMLEVVAPPLAKEFPQINPKKNLNLTSLSYLDSSMSIRRENSMIIPNGRNVQYNNIFPRPEETITPKHISEKYNGVVTPWSGRNSLMASIDRCTKYAGALTQMRESMRRTNTLSPISGVKRFEGHSIDVAGNLSSIQETELDITTNAFLKKTKRSAVRPLEMGRTQSVRTPKQLKPATGRSLEKKELKIRKKFNVTPKTPKKEGYFNFSEINNEMKTINHDGVSNTKVTPKNASRRMQKYGNPEIEERKSQTSKDTHNKRFEF